MNLRPHLTFAFVLALALACLAAPPARAAFPAQGNFGINGFDVSFANEDGSPATQAGSHPFAMTTTFGFNEDEAHNPEGWVRDFTAELPPGFVADVSAYPRCTTAEFLVIKEGEAGHRKNDCRAETQVGITATSFGNSAGIWATAAVFNLVPPPGVLIRLGFTSAGINVIVDGGLDPATNNAIAGSRNTPQVVKVYGAQVQLWGDPSSPEHDELRGFCGIYSRSGLAPGPAAFQIEGQGETCPVIANSRAFLTLPTTCAQPLQSSYEAFSWEGPSALDDGFDAGSALTHDAGGNPAPFSGCGKLPFHPSISSVPTIEAAQSATGLDFSLDVHDEGLISTKAGATSQSDIEKTVVTLPKGLSVNPSQAEGLEVCSEADLREETLASGPGEGCPEASKIGTIEVETPLLGEAVLKGSLFVAEPYRNLAGDSLIAVYVVIKDPALGILVKQPIKVEPDPVSGQLISTAADMPQLPFSSFRLHFREGARAPLISPPGCGTFETLARLYPRSGSAPVESISPLEIISGPNGSPCPRGAASFSPGFRAGTDNNAAGRYSPFNMGLTRADGEQDITKLSFTLPPGVVGKIAGVTRCPETGIARAKSRTGAHGGKAELADPSCPAASQIGRTVAGAGVGSQLTYVPGKVYLAGPYHGDPLSVVSITPAVAGPFDAGAVVVRVALRLNPVTAEVEVDGSASDPIPHILQGIPLNVRDLRVLADRPEFTLNATSCAEEQARATLFGGGTVLAPTADTPVGLTARYQASGCASLGFAPKLGIKLKGGTKRGGHPALKALVTPREGDANFSRAAVTLPHSAFLDQAHIRTICTRVQFAAGAGNGTECPAGARYGYAHAWSPLLDEPLQGPVFLRSSSHNLPDLVIALHGIVDIDLAARIDSVHGGIRSTFTDIPDAPVSRFVLEMQGGSKGLIVNSGNLCLKPDRNRATADLGGQNGKLSSIRPVVGAQGCAKAKPARRRHA